MRKQELQTQTKVTVSSGVGAIILTAYMLLIVITAVFMGLFS